MNPPHLETFPQGVRIAVEAAQEKKAGAITVLDLSGLGAFTQYFVICTGFSTPQVQAICGEDRRATVQKSQTLAGASRRAALRRMGAA